MDAANDNRFPEGNHRRLWHQIAKALDALQRTADAGEDPAKFLDMLDYLDGQLLRALEACSLARLEVTIVANTTFTIAPEGGEK